VRSVWLPCGRLLVPDHFAPLFHAFNVQSDDDWFVLRPNSLADHNPVDYFILKNQEFVSLR